MKTIFKLIPFFLFSCIVYSTNIIYVNIGTNSVIYKSLLVTPGTEISINNNYVVYISSFKAINGVPHLCVSIAMGSSDTLNSVCIAKDQYTQIGKYILYFLGNNTTSAGIFISNGVTPTILVKQTGKLYVNNPVKLTIIPIIAETCKTTIVIKDPNNNIIAKYPNIISKNCQGYSCKIDVSFDPVSVGEYTIDIKTCFYKFCISTEKDILVSSQNSESSSNQKNPKYICKKIELHSNSVYRFNSGELVFYLDKIIRYKYSENPYEFDLYINGNLYNLKLNKNITIGKYNISVISVNLANQIIETTTYTTYIGTVTVLICKENPNSLFNIYLNVNKKEVSPGSSVIIDAGVQYIENILVTLEVETPNGGIINLGKCVKSNCKFKSVFKPGVSGEYTVILKYCLPSYCSSEKVNFFVGAGGTSNNKQSNSNSNIYKIFKSGIYKIPTGSVVYIYTSNGVEKFMISDIERSSFEFTEFTRTSLLYTRVYNNESKKWLNLEKNGLIISDNNLMVSIEKIIPTKLIITKCTSINLNCVSKYNGYVYINVNYVKNTHFINLHPGVNVIYLGIDKTVGIDYFTKYCSDILAIYQLTNKNGWSNNPLIYLGNVLYIYVGQNQCEIPIPNSNKFTNIEGIVLLIKTLLQNYKTMQNNVEIKVEDS